MDLKDIVPGEAYAVDVPYEGTRRLIAVHIGSWVRVPMHYYELCPTKRVAVGMAMENPVGDWVPVKVWSWDVKMPWQKYAELQASWRDIKVRDAVAQAPTVNRLKVLESRMISAGIAPADGQGEPYRFSYHHKSRVTVDIETLERMMDAIESLGGGDTP